MAKSDFTFKNSATETELPLDQKFFLCNSLEKKRRFFYYKRGPLDTPDYGCGTKRHKVRADKVISFEPDGSPCANQRQKFKVFHS